MGELARQFGMEVRRLRRLRSLTQPQLADATGLSEEWVRQIERGVGSPSFDTLEALGKALGAPVGELFTFARTEREDRLSGLLRATEGLSPAELGWLEEIVRCALRRPVER